MSLRNVRLLVICSGILFSACSAQGPRSSVTSLPALQSGEAQVFVDRCSACHAAPHPARHDFAGWQYLVALMEMRMAERGFAPLSDADRTAILTYLQENAR